MENASKALIIAAEILLGVMIISLAVYVFNMFAGYSEERYSKIEETQIAEFNDRFYKFYGTTLNSEGVAKPIECTIHDIVSLANFAQKHNLEYSLIEEGGQGSDSYKKIAGVTTTNSLYVQIDLQGESNNLELKSNSYLVNLIKQNDLKEDAEGKKTETKYYECVVCEPQGGNKRVNYVRFKEIR